MSKPHHTTHYRFATLMPVADRSAHSPTVFYVNLVILAVSGEQARSQAAEAGLILIGAIGDDGLIHPNTPI